MYFDRRLWRFTEGVRGDIAASTAIGLLSALAGIARLALLGWLIAAAIAGRPIGDLALLALATAAAMIARASFDHWRTLIANRTAARVQSRLRLELHGQLVRLGPARIGAARSGDIVVVLTEGVEQLHTYFGRYLPQLAVAALTPLAIFVFLAFLDLPVALVMLVAALATLLAPAALHRMNSRGAVARSRDYKAFAAELLDSIQGLATLKAFGQSAERGRRMAAMARQVYRSTMWVLAASTMTRLVTDFGIAAGAAGALALGVWRVAEGAMPFASLVVVLMLGVEVFRPLRELRELLHTGMLGQSSAEGILDLLAQRPLIEARSSPPTPRLLPPTVSFEDVRFAYPGGRGPAHRGMSFTVAAGERVGIVGPSGSGKSTIMRLLLRFHDPQSGVVRLGGVDLRELSLDEIRRHIAVVGQDTMLFHGSIEDNLRLAKPDASEDEIESAARAANAHGFITCLPQGYATVIGERGLRLSGGQRQRIAIARALLRDAPILILDEALSAVDAENEAVIQQALDRLMQGRTTLIFAHRLSSVIGADRILALADGGVAESGRHGELMAKRGAYHALMREQAEGDDRIVGSDGPDLAASEEGVAPAAAEQSDIASDHPADDVLRGRKMGWLAVVAALLGLVRPWRAPLAVTLLLGIARVMAFIGVGVLGATAVRAVQAGEPVGWLLIGLAAASVAAGLLHWAESWLAHDVAFRLLAEMRIALFAKLDTLAPAYLLRRRSGDLVAMATHDIEMVEYFFAHTLAPAFVAVLVPAAVLIALGLMHPWLALALLPFLLLAALGPLLARRRIDALGAESRAALGALNAHAVDTIQGIAEIAAFQAEPARRAALAALSGALGHKRTAFMADLSRQSASLDLLTGLGGLAVVLAGAALAAGGDVPPGLLPLAALLAMAAFLPVSEIAQVGRQLADTLGATQRLTQVHEEKPVVADGPRADAPPQAGVPALALDRVRFRYPAATRDALVDAGFAVPAGATVALVGPSGAGKTTVAQLLLRFWDPAEGTIRLNGVDLRELQLDAVRGQIGLVAQDTYLFNDDLEANIRIGRPDATAAEVAAAVERAALGDFVASLPEGLKTRVGERGMQLSGGQRQRIAIARALLKNAPVLVLDEATSHLDAVSERAVRTALDALKRDRTTIVIAHRLSTVRDAQLIVVLDEGRVREAGTHGELLARRGLYARLIEHQTQSVRAAE